MAVRTTVVLATSNMGKLAEFRALLGDIPIEMVRTRDVVPDLGPVVEDGDTFEANARKKAFSVANLSRMVVLADDSGLEVDALHGRPGVRSARYAGERATDAENNAALLAGLEEVPDEQRTARFRCVLCMVDPWESEGDGVTIVEGVCEGRIARSPRGAGGFGYDPLFVVEGDGRTMAELSDAEKNLVSHRGRAVRAIRAKLSALAENRAAHMARIVEQTRESL